MAEYKAKLLKNGGKSNNGSVKVTANGVKTYSQVLDDLFALIDMTKITSNSRFVIAYNNAVNFESHFSLAESANSYVLFSRATAAAAGSRVQEIEINASSSKYQTAVGTSRTDDSTGIPSNGWGFILIY